MPQTRTDTAANAARGKLDDHAAACEDKAVTHRRVETPGGSGVQAPTPHLSPAFIGYQRDSSEAIFRRITLR